MKHLLNYNAAEHIFFKIKLGVKQVDSLNTPDPVYINSHPVLSLMYADDIILLSTSAKGLQSKLDKLNDYCNNVKLEYASNYRYLGL